MGKPCFRVQPVCLGGFQDRIDKHAGVGPSLGITEKPVLPANHNRTDIENETFTKDLETRLVGGFGQLPNGIQRLLAKSTPGFQRAGQTVLNKAYKPGTQGGLKLTNFSGSSIHEMVLKVGHGLHFKFKPWQAIKSQEELQSAVRF